MAEPRGVAEHYTSGTLLDRIRAGLDTLGAVPPVDLDTLSAVDEFHIGGRLATTPFLARLGVRPGQAVLDLGCGLGGPARFAAKSTGVSVTGIDLTAEYVETARALTEMAGLSDRVTILQGSILDLPFAAASFDVAYMIHVGMNIGDKARIASEAARVLRPGGVFGIYDVMRVGEGDLAYPVPWAGGPEHCAISAPRDYRAALAATGLTEVSEHDQTGFARDFFARVGASQAGAGGPPRWACTC